MNGFLNIDHLPEQFGSSNRVFIVSFAETGEMKGGAIPRKRLGSWNDVASFLQAAGFSRNKIAEFKRKMETEPSMTVPYVDIDNRVLVHYGLIARPKPVPS